MDAFTPPNSTGFFQVLWGLGWFAKIDVLILIIFSILTWAIIVSKYRQFRRVKKTNQLVYNLFKNRTSIMEFSALAAEYPTGLISKLILAGIEEWQRIIKSFQTKKPETEDTSDLIQLLPNISDTLASTASIQVERLEKNLAFLAIASTASPFLGLLGTVWGILGAFLGVRHIPVVTLQIIAPGISDALVTTVAGLLVAIPAVVAYNYYVGQVKNFANEMDRWSLDIIGDFRKMSVRSVNEQ